MNNKISLKFYLILSFIMAIMVTILIFGLAMTRKITQNNLQRVIKGDSWLISQLCETASYLSEQADNITAALAFDNEIQSAMIAYEYGNKYQPNLDEIRTQINSNLLQKSRFNNAIYECANIVIFSNDADVIGSKEPFSQKVRISDYEWFNKVKDSNGKSIWLPLSYDYNSPSTSKVLTIPIVRKIYSTQSSSENTLNEIMTVGKELGYIITYINVDMFSDIVAEDVDVYTKSFFLLDDNNRIIGCRNKELIGQTLEYQKKDDYHVEFKNREYVMTEKKLEDRNLNYVCLTEWTEVYRDGTIVASVCIILDIVLILVFSVLGIFVSKSVAIPVSNLMNYFKKAENGNVCIKEKSNIREFQTLYDSFNQTMDKIHELVNQVYENKLTQQKLAVSVKESRIQALQMQINPHFLYNTLDCINWKAQMDGNSEVAEMIRILGKFFRSNTEIKGEFTTLKDEVDNMELYMTLSKIRFGSRLHCFIDIDESLYENRVMKLLLQPLVENSIKHGLEAENIEENIWIWCGKDESELVISVKDDGYGMSPEKLQYFRELWRTIGDDNKKTDSVGLYNVMRRFYLCYKGQCNMELFSELGKGTEIVITFPMKK